VACAAVKLAALLAHKKALITFFYACTNHFNHVLSLENLNFANAGLCPTNFVVSSKISTILKFSSKKITDIMKHPISIGCWLNSLSKIGRGLWA
jgi:hypothetical protein